jgi:hypothetical protein
MGASNSPETSYLTVKMKDVPVSGLAPSDDTTPRYHRSLAQAGIALAEPQGDGAPSLLPGGETNFRHEHTRPES